MTELVSGARRRQLRERATAGAAWLDTARPGWYREPDLPDGIPDGSGIDLRTLEMASTCSCVGGQLEGNYERFRLEYGLSTERAAALGFVSWDLDADEKPDAVIDAEYRVLDQAWRTLIRHRRRAAARRARAGRT